MLISTQLVSYSKDKIIYIIHHKTNKMILRQWISTTSSKTAEPQKTATNKE